MMLASRTVAVLIATKTNGLGRDSLELFIGDTASKLQLPANPAPVLDRASLLTAVYAYTVISQPDGDLTVRVSDPSRHIVHFTATGTCIEILQANLAEQDQYAVTDVNKKLQEAYFEANREEFENELISGDTSGATAQVSFFLHEDDILGMSSTIFALGNLIASAADQPNYNPTTAWQPLREHIGHFA